MATEGADQVAGGPDLGDSGPLAGFVADQPASGVGGLDLVHVAAGFADQPDPVAAEGPVAVAVAGDLGGEALLLAADSGVADDQGGGAVHGDVTW